MRLSEKMQQALNDQMNVEYNNFWAYKSMAIYFDGLVLRGIQKFMTAQSNDEWMHGQKFLTYLQERGGDVKLGELEIPAAEWGTPKLAIERALEMEVQNSKNIYDLVHLAREEKDFATEEFLNWFLAEQVEEENVIGDLLAQIEMIGDDKASLLIVDQHIAQYGVNAAEGEGEQALA